jgi:hypothetical protein
MHPLPFAAVLAVATLFAVPAVSARVPIAPDTPAPVGDDPGAGPDEDAVAILPGPLQGSWRLVHADDRTDAPLILFTLHHDHGATTASGDLLMYPPFCATIAGGPPGGEGDCELAMVSLPFTTVDVDCVTLRATFHPTADGLAHHLELTLSQGRLVGHYRSDDNEIRVPVIAAPPPE